MDLLNNSSENKLKQVLNQHEFDFDPSAWEAMNGKLDQADTGNINTISNKESKEKNKYWIWLIFLLGAAILGGLLTLYPTNKETSISKSINPINDQPLTNNTISVSELPDRDNKNLGKNAESQIAQPIKSISAASSQKSSSQSNIKSNRADLKINQNHLDLNDSKIANVNNSQRRDENTDVSQGINFNKKTGNNNPSFNARNNVTQSSIKKSKTTISNALENENKKAIYLSTEDENQILLTEDIAIESANKLLDQEHNSKSLSSALQSVALSSIETSLLSVTDFLKMHSDEAIQKGSKLPDLIKKYDNLQKIKVNHPDPWYFCLKAGVNFRTIRNGTVTLEKNIFTSQFGEKGYLLEGNIGYRLRTNLMLETGLTYSSLAYLIQYSYYETPGNLNAWNIETLRQKVNQFNIPLRLQTSIFKTLRANIGGGVSFRSLDKKFASQYTPPTNAEEIYDLAKNNHNPLLSFWEIGLGYDRGPWMLDLKYQRFINQYQKGYTYEGNTFEGNGQEWNFIMTFGYRFQKYKDPLTKVSPSIKTEYSNYGAVGFNYGIGLATGLDRYRSLGSLWESNLEISEFTSPLKLGLWVNSAPHPRFSIQAEAWIQSQKIHYEFHAGSSLNPFYSPGDFRVTRLEVPLDLHYRLSKNLKITGGAGLEFNKVKKNPDAINNAFPEFIKTFNSIPDFYKRKNVFWNLGLAHDWDRFSLGLKFRSIFGGKDFLHPILDDGESYEFFSVNDQVIFSLNYALQRK